MPCANLGTRMVCGYAQGRDGHETALSPIAQLRPQAVISTLGRYPPRADISQLPVLPLFLVGAE
jgi:hypothetical protein